MKHDLVALALLLTLLPLAAAGRALGHDVASEQSQEHPQGLQASHAEGEATPVELEITQLFVDEPWYDEVLGHVHSATPDDRPYTSTLVVQVKERTSDDLVVLVAATGAPPVGVHTTLRFHRSSDGRLEASASLNFHSDRVGVGHDGTMKAHGGLLSEIRGKVYVDHDPFETPDPLLCKFHFDAMSHDGKGGETVMGAIVIEITEPEAR